MSVALLPFLYPFSRSGVPEGSSRPRRFEMDGMAQVPIGELDEVQAPVVALLGSFGAGEPKLALRVHEGRFLRPILGPGLKLAACGKERFAAFATRGDMPWRDNPLRYSATDMVALQTDRPAWPAPGVKRWLDDSDEEETRTAALLRAAECAFVDGVAYRRVEDPWIAAKFDRKSGWISWCFPEFDQDLERGDWNSYVGDLSYGRRDAPADRDDHVFRFAIDAQGEAEDFARDRCSRLGKTFLDRPCADVVAPEELRGLRRPDVGVAIANDMRALGSWGFVLDLGAATAALWYAARDAAAAVTDAAEHDLIRACGDAYGEFMDAFAAQPSFAEWSKDTKVRHAVDLARRWSLRARDWRRGDASDEDVLASLAP